MESEKLQKVRWVGDPLKKQTLAARRTSALRTLHHMLDNVSFPSGLWSWVLILSVGKYNEVFASKYSKSLH